MLHGPLLLDTLEFSILRLQNGGQAVTLASVRRNNLDNVLANKVSDVLTCKRNEIESVKGQGTRNKLWKIGNRIFKPLLLDNRV